MKTLTISKKFAISRDPLNGIYNSHLNNNLNGYDEKIYLAFDVKPNAIKACHNNLLTILNANFNTKKDAYAVLDRNTKIDQYPPNIVLRSITTNFLEAACYNGTFSHLYVLTVELPQCLALTAEKDAIELRQYITEITDVGSFRDLCRNKIKAVMSVNFVNDKFVETNKDTSFSFNDKVNQLKHNNSNVIIKPAPSFGKGKN